MNYPNYGERVRTLRITKICLTVLWYLQKLQVYQEQPCNFQCEPCLKLIWRTSIPCMGNERTRKTRPIRSKKCKCSTQGSRQHLCIRTWLILPRVLRRYSNLGTPPVVSESRTRISSGPRQSQSSGPQQSHSCGSQLESPSLWNFLSEFSESRIQSHCFG